MSVYVGKDVTITIQNPMEDDVSSQADGSQTVFTVSKTPISDRDLDGVANEPAHVTAYVNDSEVTVSAVNDSTGEVTLASAPTQGSKVIIEYRYDSSPNTAQELALSPKQTVEGIDGLGSDLIQEWAVLEKDIDGSIKEVYKAGSKLQLERFMEMKLKSIYSQQFWTSAALNDSDAIGGALSDWGVDEVNHELYVATDNSTEIALKTSVYPAFRNGVMKCKYKKLSDGSAGWVFRLKDVSNMYRVFITGTRKLRVIRRRAGEETILLESAALTLPGTFFPCEIRWKEGLITVMINNNWFVVPDPDPLQIDGRPGFMAWYGSTPSADRMDDFQVWIETTPHEYGMIAKWDKAGSVVKVGLDRVVFPEGSIPSPKNRPVFIVTPFKAVTAKTIS